MTALQESILIKANSKVLLFEVVLKKRFENLSISREDRKNYKQVVVLLVFACLLFLVTLALC